MRQVVIQYPDGKYHTVQATRFYGVLVNGKEEYILEYDDLTTNTRNCFTVLDKEGNTLVKRPLANQAEYSLMATRMRFMQKKQYGLSVLPGKIGLCKKALEALKPHAAPVIDTNVGKNPQVEVVPNKPPRGPRFNAQARKVVLVYVDIATNHDDFPYYLDANTARTLGLSNSAGGYYHLKPSEVDRLKEDYEIRYRNAALGFGPLSGLVNNREKPVVAAGSPPPPTPPAGGGNGSSGNSKQNVKTNTTNPPKKTNNVVDTFIIYEDIAPIREEHPFYLTRHDALRCGLKTDKEYYHLKKVELDVIRRYANIQLEKKMLAILDQKGIKQTNHEQPVKKVPLTAQELAILDDMFDKLMDFEDYYSFFGIEDLRNKTDVQVLNDPRIVNLSILLQKGVSCNNEIAINLLEFLEGFKNSLKTNKLNK